MSDPTPERWARIQAVFDAVVDLPASEQADALVAACQTPDRQLDAALHADVQALLNADAHASGLDLAAPERAAELVTEADQEVAGAAFGPWQVEREIGRGGMGAVYLVARADGAYTQHAALKRLTSAGPRRVERFRQERQILARLEHIGIARLIDGGVTPPSPGLPEGAPYLVMEYVEGVPITRHADAHQLDVEARVRLFCQVCDALGYAHRHLVVHRDVKPSNVFVTDEEGTARVKLLDFGVAKLLEEEPDASLTQTGLAHLTPEYAAPEQVEGGPITAATDVYALGVLLYELLAGQRPYEIERPTLSSIVEAVCNTRPVAPSTVALGDRPRVLRGDLDTIVMKALAKEPERRYVSAIELGDDLRRFLAGHPVVARTPTLAYRARRFAGRHRVPLLAGGVALAVALFALIAAGLRVTEERDLARQAADDAEAVAEVQGELLQVLNPAFRAELDTSSQAVLAPSITDVVDQTLDKVEAAYDENPAVLARSLASLGTTLFQRGEHRRADSLFARALDLRRPLAREGDAVIHEALLGRGLIARSQSDYASARRFFREALEMERTHPDVLGATDPTSTEMYLAGVLEDESERERGFLRTLSERRASLPAGDIGIAQAHNELASHYFRSGNSRAAYAEFSAAERIVRQQLGDLHPSVNALQGNLVFTLSRLGRYAEAEQMARRALEASQRGGLGPSREGRMRHSLSQVLFFQGHLEDAEREVRAALDLLNQAFGADTPATGPATKDYILFLSEQGRLEEALEVARRIEALERQAGRLQEVEGVLIRFTVAGRLFATGERATALEQLDGALRDLEQVQPAQVSRVDLLHLSGEMLRTSGAADRAEPLLREALGLARETVADDTWRVRRIRFALGLALADLGRTEEARPHLLAVQGRLGRVGYPVAVADPEAEISRALGESP